MAQQKKRFTLRIPSLDTFDFLAILLWIAVLLPAIQLPSSATFTFLRSVFFIAWVALFVLYVAFRINAEKKIVFYSATAANGLMAAIAGSFLLSFILSASPIDSLYGYDLSFSSSFLVLISLVVFYFALKLAGLSLEYSVSRIFSVLPITLVAIDLIALVSFLLPQGFYTAIFGTYAQYFSFFANSPAGLLGGVSQSLFLHIIALAVALWQIATVYKKGEPLSLGLYRRAVVGGFLLLVTAYLLTVSFTFSILSVAVAFGVLATIAFLIVSTNNPRVKQFGVFALISLGVVAIITFATLQFGTFGTASQVTIPSQTSSTIIQNSFRNQGVQLWRYFTGYGVGTFPYLYLQHRPIDAAIRFGNDTYFFKPATFVGELFIEHGVIGVLVLLGFLTALVLAYKGASSRAMMTPEAVILLLAVGFLLTSPSSLAVLIVFFAAAAALLDKAESLPELLPSVRAVDVKESTYTNKAVAKTGVALLTLSVAYTLFVVLSLVPPTITMAGYAKSLQRYAVAKLQLSQGSTESSKTFMDAYALASRYRQYCDKCAQLPYLNLSTLVASTDLYAGLTLEQRNASAELRDIRNMTLQGITDLLGKNTIRYDYWLTISQAYQLIAEDEKSASLYILALQSARNALSVNPYSVEANYLFLDMLLKTGNTPEINTRVKETVALLKQLVGTPYRIQFTDGIIAAREQKYDEAISLFEKIKTEAQNAANLNENDKKLIVSLAEQRIEEVKKLKTGTPQTEQNTTPRPTQTPRPTPTVTQQSEN